MDMSVVDGARAAGVCETADRKLDLQELLRQEMEMHINEGRASIQRNQERMGRIRQLKEELQKEEIKLQETHRESDQSHATNTVDDAKFLERIKRLRETHERLIESELIKMERDLQEEQVGGVEGEMSYLRRERHVLLLQMEALRRENQQTCEELEEQSRRHQSQISQLRDESLQVFRVFREALEDQRRASEGRYRTLLLDAVQDAVHLSSQNLQLQQEIQQLRRHLGQNQSHV